MTNRQLMCPTNIESIYDQVLHEIDNNILSIKLPKDRHRIQAVNEKSVDGNAEPVIDVNCLDKYGRTCKKGCPKVHVIHNKTPIPKKPEEELLLLRTTRQITPIDEMTHSLEVEFKSPRNYIPLPDPGPPPPIIIPKESIIEKKLEDKSKKKQEKISKSKNKKRKNKK